MATLIEFRLVAGDGVVVDRKDKPENSWICPGEASEHWEKRRHQLADGSFEVECGHCGLWSCERGEPCEPTVFGMIVHSIANHGDLNSE